MQIPYILRSVLRFVRKTFNRFTNNPPNAVDLAWTATPNAGKDSLKDKNIEEELKHFDKELHEMNQKFQELHNLMRRENEQECLFQNENS